MMKARSSSKFLHKLLVGLSIASTAFAAPPTVPSFQTPKINVDTLDSKAGGGQPKFSNGFDLNEISSPSAPASSTLRLYGKSDDNLYFQNHSGTESQVGSGSGQKNYVQTGSNTAAGWTASGAGITVATDTTAADLPRANTTKTGIKYTGVSGSTAFGYYDFTLDTNDYNTKMAFTFSMACGLAGGATSTCATSDFQVSVNSCTVAWSSGSCSGTSTRLALSTDSSAISALPANTGTYRTTFDAPGSAAAFIQVQVGLNATQSHSLVLSDIVVGPGVQTQGAAVSAWLSYTPTVSGLGAGSTANNSAVYRRVGESVEIEGYFKKDGTGGSGSQELDVSLPTGLTINTASLSGGNNNLGTVATFNANTSGNYSTGTVTNDTSTQFTFTKQGGSAAWSGADATANSQWNYHAIIPTNEWAGAGTVNVVQNDCEFASNTSSANNSDTTSFAYGPAGSTGILATTNLTGDQTKRVRFLTPIQVTDQLTFQFIDNHVAGGIWINASEANQIGITTTTQGPGAGKNFGVSIIPVSGTPTDADAYFAEYASPGATYGSAGNGWTTVNTSKWRIKKCSGGQAVGFSTVSANAAGLVPASNTNLDDGSATRLGFKRYAIGTAYNGGNIPTLANENNMTSVAVYGGDSNLIPYQDQAGNWRLKFNIAVSFSSLSLNTGAKKLDMTLTGVSFFDNGSSTSVPGEAISFNVNSTSAIGTGAVFIDSATDIGAFVYVASGSASITNANFSGDVRLASKPTWAY